MRKNTLNQNDLIFGRVPSKRFIIITFLLAHVTLLIMMVFTFPVINGKLGTEAFDLKTFGYSESEALAMLQHLDQATINFYLFPQLFLLDILYPVLLALFLSALISRLLWLAKIQSNYFFTSLKILPFIAMTCDYLENLMIALMITNTVEVSHGVVKLASMVTQMKGIFTSISWVIIIILFVVWLKRKRAG